MVIFIIPFGVVWLSAHYGEGFPEFLRKIATFFQNKVVVPALNLVSTGILIITGNEIYPIETMEDLQEVAAERRRSWYIPWKQRRCFRNPVSNPPPLDNLKSKRRFRSGNTDCGNRS